MNRAIRIECVSQIMEDLGVTLTQEQIETIVDEFSGHIDMEAEMSFQSRGGLGGKTECEKCKSLKMDLDDARRDIEIYQQSVKNRRNASEVYIDRASDRVMFVP